MQTVAMSGLGALATVARRVMQRLADVPPSAPWAALQVLALWPHGRWVWKRMLDGSDDPLGLAALGMLVLLLHRLRAHLKPRPDRAWLVAAVGLTVAATWAAQVLPALLAATLAAAALACMMTAWLAPSAPRAALAGLVMLSLPLVASLQFYVGYPLRVITAQASTWALQLAGIDAVRGGASMVVRGQLVLVDAPCSGVQMAWMGYFVACAAAAWTGLRDAPFVMRLAPVGLLVLAGNVVRNTWLVALESRPGGLSSAAHEAIGLVVLVTVLALVCAWMQRGVPRGYAA